MKSKGKRIAICGIILQLGLLVGIAGTVVGMIRAFTRLSEESADANQQQALADDIGLALYTDAVGLIVAAIGIVLLLTALWGTKYRSPWFSKALWIMSIIWILCIPIPIGLIIGIIVMIYLFNHKKEFAEQEP